MFPGIPQLFERSFDMLSPILFQSPCKFYTKYVYFNVTEDKIAKALDSLVKEFPKVLIGSYPQLFHRWDVSFFVVVVKKNGLCFRDYKVKITIESTEEKSMKEAYNKLLQIVPEDSIVTNYKSWIVISFI